MEDGRKAEGFSPHRTDNQGGHPPYLRAAQSGDAFRLSEASPDWAAVIILGSPPPGGGRTGYGCRRQPPTMRHKPKEGATDCAHIGWGGGGIVC